MTHKIFISQSELTMGRNRAIRRLERILDSQQKTGEKGMTGCPGLRQEVVSVVSADIHICDYVSICPVECKKKPEEYCALRKFYDKYKSFENGRYLGI